VPLDFFISFKKRPKNLSNDEVEERKKNLFKELEDIKLLGDEVDNLEKNGVQKKFFFYECKKEI
jgi:hypothetical protein